MSRKYTILILPHARARFRKLHLSEGFVYAITAAVAVLLLAGLVAPHLVFKLNAQTARSEELEAHNLRLREEKLRFEESLGDLNRKLASYEEQARSLARELGIDEFASDEPAAGGPDGAPASPEPGDRYSTEFEALRARTGILDLSFEQLNEAWQERERMLASTPNGMPVRGWFSHGYGWRKDPFTGNRAFHRGLDIVAPRGTPVHVPADGVVTKIGRWGNYGKHVEISHGFGYVTRYAHLSEILVRHGQRLERGVMLGRVGSTGRSTGPHLHYEVFRDGRHVNPWRYLGDAAF